MTMKTIRCNNKEVPSLIFGTLTMAPMQRNLPVPQGGKLISTAIDKGLRWLDTAQMYGSYGHVKTGLNLSSIHRDELVISTKSTAKTKIELNKSLEEALDKMGLEYIDVFLMHAVRSQEDFNERSLALEGLQEAKAKGLIGQIGISTHSTKFAQIVAQDERFDWYHLMLNIKGTGLIDGTLAEQEKVIEFIKQRGAKVFAMKPLGGGYLGKQAEEALAWIRDHPFVEGVALGMASTSELEMNIRVFSKQTVSPELKKELAQTDKKLFIVKPICNGCKTCEQTCEHSAICVQEGKALVDASQCILCGYCVPTCPQFAIRII